MNKIVKLFTITLLTSIMILSPLHSVVEANEGVQETAGTTASCELKLFMQRLWIDHVGWTRSFIVSDLANLEDKADVLERLLKNQDDIGNAIKPFYGEEAGNQLSKLLREHIEIGGKVVDAAKNSNTADFEKYNKLWYKNADQIAKFLSSANPFYSEKVLRDMLHKHLQFVTDQVTTRLNKNWKGEIEAYDKGEDHMIEFANILSEGIMKQFPDQFN